MSIVIVYVLSSVLILLPFMFCKKTKTKIKLKYRTTCNFKRFQDKQYIFFQSDHISELLPLCLVTWLSDQLSVFLPYGSLTAAPIKRFQFVCFIYVEVLTEIKNLRDLICS